MADDDGDKRHFFLYRLPDEKTWLHIFTENDAWQFRVYEGGRSSPRPFSLTAFNEGLALSHLDDERCYDESQLPLETFLDRTGAGRLLGKVDAADYGGVAIYRHFFQQETGVAR